MEILRSPIKTGKSLLSLGALAIALGFGPAMPAAHAAGGDSGVSFTVRVDQPQVGQDESVSLRLTITTENGSRDVGEPQFKAPDFEAVNEFRQQRSEIESRLDEHGQINTVQRQTVELTKVLRPLKTGNLRVSGIAVVVDGHRYTHPDISVEVTPPGAGTPPPRGYGGSGVGLRGAGKRASGSPVFLRAEVDKDHAVKGEQVIVSYYIYQRTRTFNIDITKYPTLGGFLREDLEMPIMGHRLDTERVVVDGAPYERMLLVRYAAYPLQDGKLKVDPMAIKFNYYANAQGGDLDQDQDPFMNFFQQLSPHAGSTESKPVVVDVTPLPEATKPASFTGGVGDFNITSAVDKYDVRANEAVTVTVKIEGQGNVSAISEPKASWPANVELYDSHGTAKTGKAGTGEKVFEFLLIPRQTGKLDLPPLEFSYFDPKTKQYVTKKTDPIALNVLEGNPTNAVAPKAPADHTLSTPAGEVVPPVPGAQPAPPSLENDQLIGLKPPESAQQAYRGQPVWRWLYWLFLGSLLVFVSMVAFDFLRRVKASAISSADQRQRAYSKSWDKLRSTAAQAPNQASWDEVSASYERLTGLIFDALDERYRVGARSLPRSELEGMLVGERGLAAPTWDQLVEVLEFAELVRFASSAGAVSQTKARMELGQWVSSAEKLVKTLRA